MLHRFPGLEENLQARNVSISSRSAHHSKYHDDFVELFDYTWFTFDWILQISVAAQPDIISVYIYISIILNINNTPSLFMSDVNSQSHDASLIAFCHHVCCSICFSSWLISSCESSRVSLFKVIYRSQKTENMCRSDEFWCPDISGKIRTDFNMT